MASYTAFVIKRNHKGTWEYLPPEYAENREEWMMSPYGCRQFNDYEQARDYLLEAFKNKHWGGIFEIGHIFISK